MKHFVTLAALLTSLSAFAQLPYNPDANNDGHIGAFDLTSLLSVYSGNFSNGVLGEGTQMAEFNLDQDGYAAMFFFDGDDANSWVVDLSLVPVNSYGNATGVLINGVDLVNGTTLTIIKPSDRGYSSVDWSSITINQEYFNGVWYEFGPYPGKHTRFVWWNTEWLVNDF